jgi:pyruvyltransferase
MRVYNSYHWIGRPNFGDAIAPYLLDQFCPNFKAVWAPIAEAEIITVGSVLEHIPARWPGYVLGSGRLYPDRLVRMDSTTTVLGLRGPLTARAWPDDVAIGDPGLLADELVGSQTRIYDLGIVPHWSDTKLKQNPHYYSPKWSTKLIDIAADPLEVVRTIGQCKKIVSSSLHGLIIADAFGIPRKFEYTERFDKEGKLFKFYDYSASIGAEFEPGKLIRANAHRVDDRKSELYDAYKLLNTLLR